MKIYFTKQIQFTYNVNTSDVYNSVVRFHHHNTFPSFFFALKYDENNYLSFFKHLFTTVTYDYTTCTIVVLQK